MARINRRTFLKLAGASFASYLLDPRSPSPVRTRFEQTITEAIGERGMGVEIRKLNSSTSEQFRIQINPFNYYPVASAFKSFLILYYFWKTPQEEWDYGEGTTPHSVAVYSNNVETGVLIDEVGRRIRGNGNAIEKFNDFLTYELFMSLGLYSWNWENTPTENLVDTRFAARGSRVVRTPDGEFLIDNVCRPAELADGYALLARTDNDLIAHPYFQEVLTATRELLSISAEGYQSPIERAFPNGYMGKDGILPSDQLPVGRVIADAGIITVDDGYYIVSFMAAGESESTVLEILRLISDEIQMYQTYTQIVRFPQ
jgi:hypothetical protein